MEAEETVDAATEPAAEEHDGLLDRMRDVGVGTEDPNIVGDAGPVDTPPGHYPDGTLGPGRQPPYGPTGPVDSGDSCPTPSLG